MAILKKEEILNKIRERLGEDTSDNALQFIEDVSDTIEDYETKAKDTTDWEKKYKENDDAWRKKYRDRFFNSPAEETVTDEPEPIDDESIKNLKYEDLFKEETK